MTSHSATAQNNGSDNAPWVTSRVAGDIVIKIPVAPSKKGASLDSVDFLAPAMNAIAIAMRAMTHKSSIA